jgi:hypothetical protein
VTGFVGILILIALFLLFPLLERERAGECSGRGCWKKRLGFGCGACPMDETPSDPPD